MNTMKNLVLVILMCLSAGIAVAGPSDGTSGQEDTTPLMAFPVRLFQRLLSSADGDRCPMTPSCSPSERITRTSAASISSLRLTRLLTAIPKSSAKSTSYPTASTANCRIHNGNAILYSQNAGNNLGKPKISKKSGAFYQGGSGGRCGFRTCDLHDVNVALYP